MIVLSSSLRWMIGSGTVPPAIARPGIQDATGLNGLVEILIRVHPRKSVAKNPSVDLHTLLCNTLHMATNLALDDKLIVEAQRAGKHKTKKEAVTAALSEYVRRRKQLGILKLFGTIDYDPSYDYKAERRRKRNP